MHGLMSYRRFGRARSLRSDRTLVRARSLCSDRAPARARSLRSDRAEWTFGRYVATELWLELGHYVANERSTRLVTALAAVLPGSRWIAQILSLIGIKDRSSIGSHDPSRPKLFIFIGTSNFFPQRMKMESCKMFIGRLSWKTTEYREYFRVSVRFYKW
ncbi:hypothetical protein DY000_02060822 [Brassica cretica]|uniref:Uncharacterized protein n=1 Tax=Brassica cretica TaxID=69181 RepID=A0ABQ7AW37_BRACR|nr:hypothetical protein DY000_02060822 [Brassica cretica]